MPLLIGVNLLGAGRAEAADPFLRRTATVEVVARVGPAVVNIRTIEVASQPNPFGAGPPSSDALEFYRRFFEGGKLPQTRQNLGSGVIIDSQRHVLTNEHVISRADRIWVSLRDGREFEAHLIGADPNNDLAVLRIDTEAELPWVAPGTSADLMIGEPVIAIGNPFGLSNTVTTGVISALNRSLNIGQRVYHNFLQTDASINPGNSGGPLLNAEGSLIAVNSVINTQADGIGFAIPIDVAKRIASELIEHGEILPVWLGLEFQELDPALQEVMDLPDGVFGPLVNTVDPKGPAALGGLRRGDVVLEMDGHPIPRAGEFFKHLKTVVAGQEIVLEVWRNGSRIGVNILADEIPTEQIDNLAKKLLGVRMEPDPRGGFIIAQVVRGGPAARRGFERGDILLAINGRALRNRNDLRRALVDLRGRKAAYLVVLRDGRRYPVTLDLL